MEIRRREDVSRIAVDLKVALAVVNDDIVVNKEVRVVVVFVLASDLDEPPVLKRSERRAESIVAPNGSRQPESGVVESERVNDFETLAFGI
jgi:hypothetical protein